MEHSIDREKVISELQAWIDDPYARDTAINPTLVHDALALLKEQDETINDLTDTIRQLNQHIKDLSEYMTPYGKVKDIKAYAERLKEQKKGKWIDHTFAHGDDIECPFCNKKWNVIDNCTETFDYCPGCGAKLS